MNKFKLSDKKIEEAFSKDNFKVVGKKTIKNKQGKVVARGFKAYSLGPLSPVTNKPKRAYYIEGGAREMGHLMGSFAGMQVLQLTQKFPYNVLDYILSLNLPKALRYKLYDFVLNILRKEVKKHKKNLPPLLIKEIQGLVEGVKEKSPDAKINYMDVLMVNIGFDILTALLLDPKGWLIGELHDFLNKKLKLPITRKDLEASLKTPSLCHAFSVTKGAAKPNKNGSLGHYFARELQFPTGNVIQKSGALVIYNPHDGRIPLVAATAPGLVGAFTAMNLQGVIMGVDSIFAANVDLDKIGINSLAMVRHAMHHCNDAKAIEKLFYTEKTGVPFLYPAADGKTDTSMVVETGYNSNTLNPWPHVEESTRKKIKAEFKKVEKKFPPLKNGTFIRYHDYAPYTKELMDLNKKLLPLHGAKFHPENWSGPNSVFCSYWPSPEEFKEKTGKSLKTDKNKKEIFGFGFYFFPPQRETASDILIATNHYLHPRLRLFSMNKWINESMVKPLRTDIQWRYDILNVMIRKHYGKIDFEKAWDIINFLSPDKKTGRYQDYWKFKENPVKHYKSKDGKRHKAVEIQGEISVADLKTLRIRSNFGYYTDSPVEINLRNYFPAQES